MWSARVMGTQGGGKSIMKVRLREVRPEARGNTVETERLSKFQRLRKCRGWRW